MNIKMRKMRMARKKQTDDQIITFDGIDYKYSELPDDGKIIVNQLNIIERDILQTKMLLDRHEAAKMTFVTQFKEVVIIPEPESSDKH
jgi:hypothetical protein